MSDAPRLLTFGCRLNAYESEVMRALARQGGAGAETIIINSCAVTGEAERQLRQAIRRMRRDDPNARIIVTGCAAQINPDRYAAMPEVDRVLGNADKLKAENWQLDAAAIAVSDLEAIKETAAHLIDGFDGRARAFVQIQQGCDHRCTFCIIPFARGNNRSLPVGAVAAQIHRLVAGGFGEIVLTGVDIAAYGRDLPGAPSLGQLARRILKLTPDLPRLRLSSLDPAAIDDDLWQVLAEEPRLMPHLHLSVQHGADTILKRMKRRHSRADAIAVAAKAKSLRPGLTLGADIIAGFPTETDAHFADSLSLIAECGFTWLHVFAYSPRPGTPAARMPQLPGTVIRERAARLRLAATAAVEGHLAAQTGRSLPVLIERERLGRCEDFTPVRLEYDAAPGRLATVRITGHSDGHLIAASIEAERTA